MKKNMRKGFTIVELIIVIAVIGILASVLIPTYSDVVTNANDSAALQTARSTMTNWLAKYTTPSGVPTSKKDSNGIMHYAAYFVYEKEDEVWQYRYTKQGVEEVPKAEIIDWDTCAHVDNVYLDDPAENAGAETTTVYTVTVSENDQTSTYYYAKLDAESDYYSLGGADVYTACKKYYVSDGASGYTEVVLDGYSFSVSVQGDSNYDKYIQSITLEGNTIKVTLKETYKDEMNDNIKTNLTLYSNSETICMIAIAKDATTGQTTISPLTKDVVIDSISFETN